CFGAPFMLLHPTRYAEMLSEKMKNTDVNVWLVNTGWTGGPFGTGERINLKHTRAMVAAALAGELANVETKKHDIFGLNMITACPHVPQEVLDPEKTWKDPKAYKAKAQELSRFFKENFEKYKDYANEEILAAQPG